MTSIILFSFLVAALFLHLVNGNAGLFPKCTTMIYDTLLQREVNVPAMLYNCSNNILNNLFPPSYYKSRSSLSSLFSPTIVNTSITINHLIEVNDITSQITLDIYLQHYWIDPRINLPDELWKEANPANSHEGLEILPYVRHSANPLNVWLPDIQIMEEVSLTLLGELLHIFPDGGFFWSRHLLLIISDSTMDLHAYPNDQQSFTLTLQSYAYTDEFVRIQPLSNTYLTLHQTPSSHVSQYDIMTNPLWTYDSNEAIHTTIPATLFFHPTRAYSTVTIQLRFSRQAVGIIYRLALPILIFMIIVGCTYWAELSKRIDITITMLLVTAAMYLVIGQNIPLVGYFTVLDLYVTSAFILLSVTILMHFFIYRINQYSPCFPFLAFLRDLIVFTSRAFSVPVAAGLFLFYFHIEETAVFTPIMAIIVITFLQSLSTIKQLPLSFDTAYQQCLRIEAGKVYVSETDELIEVVEENNEMDIENGSRLTSAGKLRQAKLSAIEQWIVDNLRSIHVRKVADIAAVEENEKNSVISNEKGARFDIMSKHKNEKKKHMISVNQNNEFMKVGEDTNTKDLIENVHEQYRMEIEGDLQDHDSSKNKLHKISIAAKTSTIS